MSLFFVPKRWKPDRIIPIMGGRNDAESDDHFLTHVVQKLSIVRGGGFDAYTKDFTNWQAPLPDITLADLPAWADAERHITQVVKSQQDVLVFGDYDCDGVTATTLMLDYLECAGLDPEKCHWFIPNRFDDRYGLTLDAVKKALRSMKVKPALLIAVDCGSPSKMELEYLKNKGISTVVIDHHPVEMAGSAHPATFHLNPRGWPELAKRKDLHELCAAGLAFLFCRAMAKHNALEKWDEDRATILAGLASYVDVMPIFRINRALVKKAMLLCNEVADSRLIKIPGLLELHHKINDSHKERFGYYPLVDEKTFGFEWGPCTNATGRLDEARRSLELLRVQDAEAAKPIAEECNKMNQRRISAQRRVLEEARFQALAQVGNMPPVKVLLAVAKHWNIGVVGVVAGKLREEFERPAIVCGMDATGIWRGSGRSVEGFDMGDALRRASLDDGVVEPRILSGGGHIMAGGLSFREDQRPDFHNWINAQCKLTEADFVHTARVVAMAEEFPPNWWASLQFRLSPFGQNHRELPILLQNAWLECFWFRKFRKEESERDPNDPAPQNLPRLSPEEYERLPDLFAIGCFQPRNRPKERVTVYWKDAERARREWRRGRLYTLELDIRAKRTKRKTIYYFRALECWLEGEPRPQPAYKQADLELGPLEYASRHGILRDTPYEPPVVVPLDPEAFSKARPAAPEEPEYPF